MLEGVAIGLACTAVVGVLTFWLHHKLPYRRMLIDRRPGGRRADGDDRRHRAVLQGPRLDPRHPTPFTVPDWMGSWFEIYSYWETIGAQLLTLASRTSTGDRDPRAGERS